MRDVLGYPHQTEKDVEETCERCGHNLTEVTVSRYEHTLKEGFYRVFLYCKNCDLIVTELPS